ncbi:uncharacterized protein LOC120261924 [Dioscorea cayenensis subsp. rotundata]|uniref:Uncharacterized protein LOC120261924 n=1 Tax=Dioscorea cayennensis subsp. rotundata TaxID=55577 RepID=A0AB40BET0_DIOCR|nr:uncharacterized protein LOC120261924 [Dioscorea cayenensis subsp. rotundata]
MLMRGGSIFAFSRNENFLMNLPALISIRRHIHLKDVRSREFLHVCWSHALIQLIRDVHEVLQGGHERSLQAHHQRIRVKKLFSVQDFFRYAKTEGISMRIGGLRLRCLRILRLRAQIKRNLLIFFRWSFSTPSLPLW